MMWCFYHCTLRKKKRDPQGILSSILKWVLLALSEREIMFCRDAAEGQSKEPKRELVQMNIQLL